MLLEVKNIRVHYDKVEAVKGITLAADKANISTLIGANGAGKTTTLRAISGLKKLTAGEIWFDGKRIDGLPAHRITGLGIAHVPEGRRLFGLMTVRHNLATGAYLQKDRRTVAKTLDEVFEHFPRLKERQKQLAKTLSGGEQQMLAMGRALMAGPKLLMLDEPSMGLAPMLVEKIFDIVREINDQGTTILLVEQNANLALEISHRGYVLETGKVSLAADAASLLRDPHVQEAYLGA
jgi:branched-chain amino acid transport system ATP-binding protein